jgi:alpha-beta hydrolase superfamily lysophospholipase
MVLRAQLLQKHGFSTLIIDLQAHGETPGTAITFGKRESGDVVAALAWIKNRAPDRKIGIIGCSLGGASALLAPQPLGVDAVVLEAVYPRIHRAVENRVRLRLGAAAPLLTPLLLWQLGPRLHIKASDLEPIRSIGKLGAPVMIAAGSDDEHTTLGESEELYQAATKPKEIWIINGAKHQDLLAFDPVGYKAHVVRFLTNHLRGALPYHTERLDKAEVEKLIAERLAQKAPLVFGSNQGLTRCCDLGEPNIQFLPDHQILAFGDGYVPWEAVLSYKIADDGKIVLHQSDDAARLSDIHDAYIYRYGPALYLEKDSDTDPDLSFEPGTLWPFKAVNIDSFALKSLVR